MTSKRAIGCKPVVSPDPSDPKLAHLDGLNLSRAWMLEGILSALPHDDPRRPALRLRQTRIGAPGSQRSLVRITKADIGSEALQFISQLSEALKKGRRTKFRGRAAESLSAFANAKWCSHDAVSPCRRTIERSAST